MSSASTDALKLLFGYNYQVLKKNVEGVTHEESLIQPQGGGNCLNWVLGHILATRNVMMDLTRSESVLDRDVAERYKRGSAPIRDGSDAQSLEKLVAVLDRSQESLIAGLDKLSADDLAAKSPEKAPGDTVGDTLFVLQFHEAYHAGQTGLLRRMAGHEGAIK